MKKLTELAAFGCILLSVSCGTHVERTLSETGTKGGSSTNSSGGSGNGGTSTGGQVGTPTLSPSSGYYFDPVTVTATTDTSEAAIYCTQDGSEPTSKSALYATPLQIARSTILRCRAYKSGMTASKIAEGLYVIEGSPPDGNGLPTFHSARIEISFGVDDQDEIRIRNGVMDLIHVSGDRSENPVVKITRADGTVTNVNPWDLSPFHIEDGITCNWSPSGCVSSPLNLKLTDFAKGGFGYIPRSSIDLFVGRGSVTVNDQDRVVVRDSRPSWSGYWFAFEYWYRASE